MPEYTCFRCGYVCNQKNHLLNHLSRKYQCKSKNKEIDNLKILELNKIDKYNKDKYTFTNKKYNCIFCDKTLSNYKKKWKHEKICKNIKNYKNIEIENSNLKNKLIEAHKIIIGLEKKCNQLETEKAKIITNNTNNTTNNIINFNLNYKEFGNETIDHLDVDFINKLLANPIKMLPYYLRDIYFNRNLPLNQTVRILDLKSGSGYIYNNKKWTKLPIKNITEKILRESLDKITSFDNYNDKNYVQYEEIIEINNKDVDIIDEENQNTTWYIVNETTKEYKEKLKNKKNKLEQVIKNYTEELTTKLNNFYEKHAMNTLEI